MAGEETVSLQELSLSDRDTAIELWEHDDAALLLLEGIDVDQVLIDRLVDAGTVSRVSWAGAAFVGPVSFHGVRFETELVDFTGATFAGVFDFSQVTVSDHSNIIFTRSQFGADARFDAMAGGRYIVFEDTSFGARCSFDKAEFPPMTRFTRTNFRGAAAFNHVGLGSNFTRLEGCVFDASTEFGSVRGPSLAKLLFIDCQFVEPVQSTQLEGDIALTVTNVEPADALAGLQNNDASRVVPIVGNVQLELINAPFDGASYQTKNVDKLIRLMRRLQPVTAIARRLDTGYGLQISMQADEFALQELDGERSVRSLIAEQQLSDVTSALTLQRLP